jgi:hypothetical protein
MCEHGDVVQMPLLGKVRTIDRCISHIVAALNAGGVTTVACCCGHGRIPGSIALQDGRELVVMANFDDARAMFSEKWPVSIHGDRLK